MSSTSFPDVGFLGDLGGWVSAMYAAHRPWFDLAHDVNREAMKMLYASQPTGGSEQQLIAALLFGRAVQSFQGCLILSARGMPADARSLVRSAAESAIALGGVAQDEAFLDRLIAAHEKHIKTMANALLNSPGCRRELPLEDISGMEAVIAEIERKYGNEGPDDIKWEALAHRVGMTALYTTIYRDMSGDGAHVSANSLNRHLKANDEAEIEHLIFEPSDRGLESTVSAAISALLHCMEALSRTFASDGAEEIVKALGARWRALCERTDETPETGH